MGINGTYCESYLMFCGKMGQRSVRSSKTHFLWVWGGGGGCNEQHA